MSFTKFQKRMSPQHKKLFSLLINKISSVKHSLAVKLIQGTYNTPISCSFTAVACWFITLKYSCISLLCISFPHQELYQF